MISLNNLLKNIVVQESIQLDDSLMIKYLAFDSRRVESGTMFFATKGTQVDGHDYIETAIKKGAVAIICEILPNEIIDQITYIKVKNSQEGLGLVASNFFDNPSSNLKVVGVTGTNGKTSTTTMLYQLFTNLGYKVGLLSTIEIRIGNETIQATHTTPDAISIQSSIAMMVDKGCSYCFMEVSSHAVDQDRIAGIQFAGGVFSNITHDHLDYHLTFANYLSAKKKFFDNLPKESFALSNNDDKNGKIIVQNCKAKVKFLAMKSVAEYTVKILDASLDYMTVKIDGEEITLKLAGEFNAYNALSAYAVAIELGVEKSQALLELSKIQPVEGRIDVITSQFKNVRGVIDYAHTPDAVEKVLVEINKINKKGQVITVIGCGGNRDKEKRPIMAKLACQLSNRVILTSDNPRNEEPKSIIDDMRNGLESDDLKKVLVVIDREEAIKTACMLAREDDIIALVGKGHEKYQEIKGERFDFDDKVKLTEAFQLIMNN